MVDKNKQKPAKPVSWMSDDDVKERLSQQCVLMLYSDILKGYSDPKGFYERRGPYVVNDKFPVYNFKNKNVEYSKIEGFSTLKRNVAKLPNNHSINLDYVYDQSSDVDPKLIIQKYYSSENKSYDSEIVEFLESLSTIQLSTLMANIRVDKFVKGSNSAEIPDGVYTLDLHGDNKSTLKDFFDGKRESIGGYGIKSLGIKQETSRKTNYSSARYHLELKMVFNSMKDLLYEYTHKNGSTYTATDVLIGFSNSVLNEQQGPLTYTTRFHVGYDSSSLDPEIFPRTVNGKDVDWKRILQEISLELFATAYQWDINITEEGKIEVVINYVGYTSMQETSRATNILFLDDELLALNHINESKKTAKEDKKISQSESKKRQEWANEDYKNFLKSGYTRFVKDLFDSGKINFAYVDSTDVENIERGIDYIEQNGDITSSEFANIRVPDTVRDSLRRNKIIVSEYDGRYNITSDQSINASNQLSGKGHEGNKVSQSKRKLSLSDLTVVNGTGKRGKVLLDRDDFLQINESGSGEIVSIPYFYFKDLVATAMVIYYENMKTHFQKVAKVNLTMDFGEIDIYDPVFPDKTFRMSIGDIPISYDLFTVWFNHYVVKPKKIQYSLKEFIRDCIRYLILPSIKADQCFYKGNNPWKKGGNADTDIDLYMNSDVSKDFKNVWNQFYIFSYAKKDRKFKSKEQDGRDGIIWLAPGRDKGIVKSINFGKNTSSMLKSHLMVRALEKTTDADKKSKVTQLREVYDVTVRTIGNSFIQTGSTVCVQPSLLDLGNILDGENESWKILGMGGYYSIVSAELNFEDGKYDGVYKGVWQGTPLSRKKNDK